MLNTFFHGGEEERPEARLQSLIGEKVRPVRSAGLDELTELNRVIWERKENLLSKIILRPLSVCGCVRDRERDRKLELVYYVCCMKVR